MKCSLWKNEFKYISLVHGMMDTLSRLRLGNYTNKSNVRRAYFSMGQAGKTYICLSFPCSLLETVHIGKGSREEICLSDSHCIFKPISILVAER